MRDHAKGRAERLAELGYVAFALDYNGDGRPHPRDEVRERIMALLGDPLQPVENLAMTAVQAVEVAERQHRLLPMRRPRIVGKMDDVHDYS